MKDKFFLVQEVNGDLYKFYYGAKKVYTGRKYRHESLEKNFFLATEPNFPKINLKIMYYDIEAFSLDTIETPAEVLSIAYYTNWNKKKGIFFHHANIKENKIITTKDKIYHTFTNERDMLKSFIEFVRTEKPMIMTGWNSDKYDMPYLINRMRKIGLPYETMGFKNTVKYDKINETYIIAGKVQLDLQKVFKKVINTKYVSYSLDNIGKKVLDIGKVEYSGSIYNLWKNNINKFIRYNIRDVMITVELDKKLNLINYFDELRRFTGCNFSDLYKNSRFLDIYVTRYALRNGIEYLPNRKEDEFNDTFKGGLVINPKVGVSNNVIVLDLKSLYPSIIVSANLSMETYTPEPIDGKEYVEIKGHKFDKSKPGIISKLIENLFEMRANYKKLYKETKNIEYDMKQYSVKVITNSIYGLFGYQKWRYYQKAISESVTYVGRAINKWSQTVIKNAGYDVIYGVTDSVFVKLPDEYTQDECIKTGIELSNKLNESYKEFAKKFGMPNNVFEIEFEKLFSKIILFKKLNYAGLMTYNGDKIDPIITKTGLSSRRGDRPYISKMFETAVLDFILNKNITSREAILGYKDKLIKDILNSKYGYDKLVIPISVRENGNYKNEPYQYRAYKIAKDIFHEEFESNKIRLMWVKNKDTDIMAFSEDRVDEFKKFNIDWEKMFKVYFNNIIDRLENSIWKINNKNLLKMEV